MQVAARHLPSAVHDEDVVAELLGLAQDLGGEHDGPAAGRLGAQHRHDRALEDRIHPGRELVHEHDRRVDEEHFRHLDAPALASREIHGLAIGVAVELEARPARRRRGVGHPAPRSRGSCAYVSRLSRTDKNISAACS